MYSLTLALLYSTLLYSTLLTDLGGGKGGKGGMQNRKGKYRGMDKAPCLLPDPIEGGMSVYRIE